MTHVGEEAVLVLVGGYQLFGLMPEFVVAFMRSPDCISIFARHQVEIVHDLSVSSGSICLKRYSMLPDRSSRVPSLSA
jgi:hypothetical protein